MRNLIAIATLFALAGCAQWNELSPQGKRTVVVSAAILVGANIIANSQGDTVVVNNCVSTKSPETTANVCTDEFQR